MPVDAKALSNITALSAGGGAAAAAVGAAPRLGLAPGAVFEPQAYGGGVYAYPPTRSVCFDGSGRAAARLSLIHI